MLSVSRKVKGLNCRDIYFAQSPVAPELREDLQLFLQAGEPSKGSQPFVTSVVDLLQEEHTIASSLRKSTAYDIRRAKEKDLVTVGVFDSPSVPQIDSFCDFFDAFATLKQIGNANRRKLQALAAEGALTLSFTGLSTADDTWLAAHAYIVGEGRARLLYSGSKAEMRSPDERQVIGRANKYMHWYMLLHFKRIGLAKYDFGGLSKRDELRTIDEFKESFGGEEIVEYNLTKGVSVLGKALVLMLRTARAVHALLKRPT